MSSSFTVDDVVEGLLREYLVKKGFNQTLDCFNSEKPKHVDSISKREVLRKALSLDRVAAKYKKEHPTAETLPPTLELWVHYQMSKLNNFFESSAQPAYQSPSRVPERVSARQALDEDPEEVSVPENLNTTFGRRRNSNMSATAPPSFSPSQTSRQPQLDSPARSAGTGSPGGLFTSNLQAPSPPTSGRGMQSTTQRMGAMSMRDEEPDDISQPTAMFNTTARRAAHAPPGTGFGSAAAHSPMARPQAPGLGPGASGRPAGAAQPLRGRGGFGGSGGGALAVEDVEDLDDDGGLQPVMPAGGGLNRTLGGVRAPSLKGQPVPMDAMRAVQQLLWGNQGQPPPSWQQGFFFCEKAGLQFGLVQLQGGPCGVLAGVQAHILAALKAPTGFTLSPSASEQQSALVAAIVEVLWQARMGPTASLVLPPPPEHGGPAGGRLSYDQMCRGATYLAASSRDALQDMVRSALPLYMQQSGWGIVLLLLSLTLSRGVPAVRADMDEPSNALMGMHGYCTQELVNLILTGQAVSNVFDGTRDLDGSQLRGITRRCRLGLLTLFEWYKYVEVGSCLKNPELPVWVVCSESHFTVLFSQDSRPLRNSLPFDLLYYDELANQEELLRLSISSDPRGGWTARVGDTIGDRGKCEGQNIPPLECVIETRWPGVKVNWNGAEPIL